MLDKYHLSALVFPPVLTHLLVVEAVVCISVRVLVCYEVGEALHILTFHPLARVQVLPLGTVPSHHLPQTQGRPLHDVALRLRSHRGKK